MGVGLLGLLVVASVPLEGAWGWLRTRAFVVLDGQDARLLVGAVLFGLGLVVFALTSPPQAPREPMTWRAALIDAAHSIPKQLAIWLILTRLLRGHLDLGSAFGASAIMFALEALRNRFPRNWFPRTPWRRKTRVSASDRSV